MKRYYADLVAGLEASGAELVRYYKALPEAELLRAAEGEWSLHQVLAHMRDTEREAWVLRARRFHRDEHPTFPNFDQEAYWASHPYSAAEPVGQIAREFLAARRQFVRLLRAAPDALWAKRGRHESYGDMTLEWLALHAYGHTCEHLAQALYALDTRLLRSLNP